MRTISMAWIRKGTLGGIGLLLAAALVWALWPQPLAVDLAPVARGPMQGVITAQGVTRVREPFAVTAPLAGTTTRAPVEVGDRVIAGETEVAVIRPADPALMDMRSRAQAEATVAEAEAAVALAEANLQRAETGLAHARAQLDRNRALAERGVIPSRVLEDIVAAHETAHQTLRAAQSELDLNRAALVRARTQLIGPRAIIDVSADPGECCLRIMAPQSGLVLSVADQNARVVQAGSPLLTIGDLDEMDIELDLLSSDAVQVQPGARGLVDRWGGEGVLETRVRRIDPAAFTRVSALGIEEQRVRLRMDLLDPPAARPGLGDGFRVHVSLIVWQADDVLHLPQPALFRQGEGWAVFVMENGRARLTPVGIGRQSEGRAEVLDGLEQGARVVLFPPSTLKDGAAIADRGM